VTGLTLHLNTAMTERAIRKLAGKAPAAIARALNRSIASGKTVAVRIVAKDMGLKQAVVRDRFAITPAVPGVRAVAILKASNKRLPLMAFGARGPVPSRGRGRGVTARIPGGAGRYPHAFIATVGIGRHTGVFQRVDGARRRGRPPHRSQLPIRELYGPSIAHVAQKTIEPVKARAMEQLTKNVQHELRFALQRQ
jgi:hypothetical protein